jgi:hypothetical protein
LVLQWNRLQKGVQIQRRMGAGGTTAPVMVQLVLLLVLLVLLVLPVDWVAR